MSADTVAKTIDVLDITTAIYTYDRTLTLWWEVDLIWQRRKMSVATASYMLMHTSAAVYLYGQVMAQMLKSCRVRLKFLRTYGYIMDVVQLSAAALFHIAIGAFTALRAYAISSRSTPLASAIFLFSVVLAAVDIYEVCTIVAVVVPDPVGCLLTVGGASYSICGWASIRHYRRGFACSGNVALWMHGSPRRDAYQYADYGRIAQAWVLDLGIIYFITILALLIVNMTLSETIVGITPAYCVIAPY
ncbi:uncharacterized protein B0H18DRAFT_1189278 [Fomitopsis serialis]|uniref:uncharacterized protein n=1 Tax=Fomitopsis serialis TaxID=139415 RepID=UPI002007EA81|nr:uncharacterized protein B0H18DRAFT_1189278 [Neoantrodia serialis]KAH9921325.1 hypothetical protein B0H18DRAFT_1189278 [Neoantrodia serialis]